MRRLIPLLAVAVLAGTAPANEKLKDVACRSVHLNYPGPAASAFYNEVAVEASAEGTYFCVCGFNKGYFGIQEQGRGKKVVIFSVWDPAAGNDPKAVDESKRVKLLHKGEGVRVGRFGGEGTGGQSFLDLDWKAGETYRFLVTARPDGADRTAFAGFVYLPNEKAWRHLVTFSTPTPVGKLGGYYSFVEDFKRDRVSTTHVRKAAFGNGWVKPAGGEWLPLETARFTADSNPVTNIDGGAAGAKFFLATGGATANTTTKLKATATRGKGDPKPPADLPPVE